MIRSATRRLGPVAIILLIAGTAMAHPGHDGPHLVHEADPFAGWLLAAVLAVAFAVSSWSRRRE